MKRFFDLLGKSPPWHVALVSCFIMTALALAFMAQFQFNPTALVRFGIDTLVNSQAGYYPEDLPPATVVLGDAGYDGQYYFWIAVTFPSVPHGLAYIDTPVRFQRVGYSAVVSLLAVGDPPRIIWAMIATNVIAPALTAWAVARYFRQLGINVWWALLAGFNPGTVLSLHRCLAESLAFLFLALDWIGYVKRTPLGLLTAALAWGLALLTREQLTTTIAVVILWEIVHLRWIQAALLSLSGTAFFGWQFYVRSYTGRLPMSLSAGWLTWPGQAVLAYLRDLRPPKIHYTGLLAWSNVPMALLALLALVLGLTAFRRRRSLPGLLLGVTAALLLTERCAERFTPRPGQHGVFWGIVKPRKTSL